MVIVGQKIKWNHGKQSKITVKAWVKGMHQKEWKLTVKQSTIHFNKEHLIATCHSVHFPHLSNQCFNFFGRFLSHCQPLGPQVGTIHRLTDDRLLKTWAGLFPDSIVELKSRFVLEATSINEINFLFSGVANVGKFLPNSYDDIKSFQGPLLSTHKQIQIIVFLD